MRLEILYFERCRSLGLDPNMKKFLKVTESLKVVLTRVDVALGSFELP